MLVYLLCLVPITTLPPNAQKERAINYSDMRDRIWLRKRAINRYDIAFQDIIWRKFVRMVIFFYYML